MEECWILIQYNNDDNYDAESIGMYSTKERAIKKVLKIIKKEFEECSKIDILELTEDWFEEEDNSEAPIWDDCCKIIKNKLAKECECYGFSYLSYKIKKHIMDE